MNKKILIVGAKGFIGHYFYTYYQSIGDAPIGTHHHPSSDFVTLDLLNPHLNDKDFRDCDFAYALIAAGISRPVLCEKYPEKSYQCNVEGPLQLAKQLLVRGITPIFLSSDYVFDGFQAPYSPHHSPAPLNTYGKQKALLEQRAWEECQGNCLILRLSKIYGLKQGDGTLFDEIMAKFSKGEKVSAAFDQTFAPLYIGDFIQQVHSLQKENARGIFHSAGPDSLCRLEIAKKIAQKLRTDHNLIDSISLDALNDGVNRPKNTTLFPPSGKMRIDDAISIMTKFYAKYI